MNAAFGGGRWACALLATVALLTMPAGARSIVAAEPEQAFAIPAQTLNQALAQYSRLSGVDILYDHSLASNRQSAAIAGRLGAGQALHDLLAGTGLVARFTGPKAAVLTPEAASLAPAAGAGPALRLDEMRVTATPLLGAPPGVYETYGRLAQSRILQRLQTSGLIGAQKFSVEFRAYLEPDGRIASIDIFRGSGDARLDKRIHATLLAAVFLPPPPPRLPQPLRFEFSAR